MIVAHPEPINPIVHVLDHLGLILFGLLVVALIITGVVWLVRSIPKDESPAPDTE